MEKSSWVLAMALLLVPVSLRAQCCIVVPNSMNPVVVDEAPLPTNGEEVVDLLRRIAESAPPVWLDRTLEAWVHVNPEGEVVEASVARSSGFEDLNAVLLAVTERMEFTPGKSKGVGADVLLRFPVALGDARSRR